MIVSLIVTTYNSVNNFCLTYRSIREQDYKDIEIIIIDGGSTDGTLEKIKEISALDPGKVKWLSEKDEGIYDAINKGLNLATGDLIGIFNDIYSTTDAISRLTKAIKNNTDIMGAHADLAYLEGDMVRRLWKMGEGRIEQGWMPAHPTLLLRREVYEIYGNYKSNYTCSADYEFMVRFLKDGNVKLAYVPETLVYMFYGGTSSNGLKAYCQSFIEACRALKQNGIRFPVIVSVKRTWKVLQQFSKAKERSNRQ